MKKLLIFPCIVLALLSCSPQENKESAEDTEAGMEENSGSSLEEGCYTYKANNSVVNFEITEVGNKVTGNLSYALAEKDANDGTFEGQLSDDKLIGTYTFMSEGFESEREVAFQVKGDQLIEGYGPLDETGTAFTDKDSISYTSTMPLSKSDCDS